jgi:hypothetical protein
MHPKPPVWTSPRLLLGAFLLLLFSTAAVTLFAPAASGFSVWELREPAPLPGRPESLYEFRRWPRRFEAYVGDSFPGRDFLIKGGNTLLWRLGMLRSSRVIEGRDNWLFLSDFQQQTIQKSRGLFPFGKEEAVRWAEQFESMRTAAAALGAELRLAIIPDKQTVYPQRLPDWAHPANPPLPTMTDQILAELSRRRIEGVLDLRPVLRTAAAERQVFWRTDSHWNHVGAFVALEQLLPWLTPAGNPVAGAVLERCRLSDTAEPFRGDLTNILGVARFPAEAGGSLRVEQPVMTSDGNWQGMGGGRERKPFRTTAIGGGPGKLLVLGDSFTESCWFVFAELSEETVFFSNFGLRIPRSLVERERPATIVVIIVERLIPASGPQFIP